MDTCDCTHPLQEERKEKSHAKTRMERKTSAKGGNKEKKLRGKIVTSSRLQILLLVAVCLDLGEFVLAEAGPVAGHVKSICRAGWRALVSVATPLGRMRPLTPLRLLSAS